MKCSYRLFLKILGFNYLGNCLVDCRLKIWRVGFGFFNITYSFGNQFAAEEFLLHKLLKS